MVLCAGDSLTAEGYPRILEEMLRGTGQEVRVVDAGVPGHSSVEYLSFLRRKKPLERCKPRFTLLQIGTNDLRCDYHRSTPEAFEQVLGAIVKEMFRQHPRTKPMLATIPPIVPDGRTFDEESAVGVEGWVNPLIRRTAARYGLVLNDLWREFSEHPEWLEDNHPTAEGKERMAALWFDVIAREGWCGS